MVEMRLLGEMAEIVIVALVITLIFLPVLLGIYRIFYKGPDQGTQASFRELAERLLTIDDGATIDQAYYVQDGYMLVGFDASQSRITQKCEAETRWYLLGFGSAPDIVKPKSCQSSACICLCDEDKLCKSGLVDCERIPDSITAIDATEFKGNFGDENNLAIYGKCDVAGFGYMFKLRTLQISRAGSTLSFSCINCD